MPGNLLAEIDFLSGLDDRILEHISSACVAHPFAGGQTIERQGDLGLGLYIISRGRVRIDLERGGIRRRVAELGPGQFFGQMSLLEDTTLSTTAIALEDGEGLLLTRESFVKIASEYPEIPIRVTAALARAEPPARNDAWTKARIRNTLIDTLENLYTLRALSRFTVAVLGCPVEGVSENTVAEIRMGEVKALFFPADAAVDMRIVAEEPGSFTLDVFTPAGHSPFHFGPVTIKPCDIVEMKLISGRVVLRNGAGEIPFL